MWLITTPLGPLPSPIHFVGAPAEGKAPRKGVGRSLLLYSLTYALPLAHPKHTPFQLSLQLQYSHHQEDPKNGEGVKVFTPTENFWCFGIEPGAIKIRNILVIRGTKGV